MPGDIFQHFSTSVRVGNKAGVNQSMQMMQNHGTPFNAPFHLSVSHAVLCQARLHPFDSQFVEMLRLTLAY